MSKPNIKRSRVARAFNRREVLSFLGATTSVWLAGCFRSPSSADQVSAQTSVPATPSSTQTVTTASICVVRPQQTEGPFFVDDNLNRSDIRSDPSSGVIKAGAPLQLVFQVSQVSNGACTPLRDAIVDVWHCDAEGVYSDVGNAVGQKFLRGSQVTTADGTAQFVTIYPGWYPGRAVHIHFKIRGTSPSSNYEFTSQLYFDDALTDQILARSPYAVRGAGNVRNDQDGLFRRGGEQLIVPVVQEGDRYVGRFNIGLEL
ncbi:intradiol ring-cleavage dioxygenase [Oscillatoria sp. FACHB-1407]|uniref:intradiol ring-cleavage dioxygenase n=1 Tax=Oscillatoria sp. FACHB-1407 TaxID=2692847 RepID=UPI001685C9DB|nr:intradiol ring-cleavage dioxygenase [Oscillatoria sp. FACHB-1407]MBD2461609.1 intradiol ring-cleavage dioxygenase [Oscillatoria sp. FACHB-1407]